MRVGDFSKRLLRKIIFRRYKFPIFSLRKRYVFLISRSISLVTANLYVYIFYILGKFNVADYVTFMVLITFEEANFFHIGCKTGYHEDLKSKFLATYFGLTILLYIAITKEVFYKTRITLRFCYIYLIVSFLFFLLISVFLTKSRWTKDCFQFVVTLFELAPYFPDQSPVKCSYEDCQKPLLWTFSMYFSTIFS